MSEFPQYTAAERRADAAVHGLGMVLGLVGCAALGLTMWTRALDFREVAAVGLYGVGLMTMLVCSALYNLTEDGPRKRLYRRLDHAAIFLMIAGTYTPFALIVLGGTWGVTLLAVVWIAALVGIAVELLGLRRHDGLSVAVYLLLGWAILPALAPLSAVMPSTGLVLLVVGGILYSVGAAFHVWSSMPYQNAIWHGFVLAAAGCHYTAVVRSALV